MLSFHTLHLHGRAPIYAQIIDFVKQAIFTGQAQTGDPLPPRRGPTESRLWDIQSQG